MKTKKIFLVLLFMSVGVYATNIQNISCSGTSQVTGPTGANISVVGYGNNVTIAGNAKTCNTCFYAGHIYKGDNLNSWYDTITVDGSGERIMWQDETWVGANTLTNHFIWGDNLSGSFFFSPITWSQVAADSPTNANRKYKIFPINTSNLTYIESPSTNGISLNTIQSSAVPADRNQAGYVVAFNGATHSYNSTLPSGQKQGAQEDHVQCAFIYPRWCGDGIVDSDKGEQCDDGNNVSGDGCSATCTIETPNTPICNNLGVVPATLTKDGGTITATCSGTNTTQYKFVLKQGTTVINTVSYQSGTTASFSIPNNTDTNSKTYSVDCYVKNASQSDITSTTCSKNIIIPGTTVVPGVCTNLTVSSNNAQINTPITYSCSATNASSYIIRQGASIVGTMPDGTINFPAAGTYSLGCFVDGQTTTPVTCAKSITITNPPTSTIPSIFIDKDDSTPGTPDSDGNDIQRVQNNGTATFTIRVLNNGNEALKTVVIDDPLSSDCVRNSAQTASLYAGGPSTDFDVGESFTYQCTKTNVVSGTFPNNRNTASVKGVGVTSGQNVTDSDVTEIYLRQGNPNILIEKNDTDNLDDTQEVDDGGTAKFSIKVTNNGSEALDNIRITDALSPDCQRDESQTRDLVRAIGNHDSLFDPGEVFAYTCRENSVTNRTFPNGINTACTNAIGVDTNGGVNSCNNTSITIGTNTSSAICDSIDSSSGTFGGAPFQTIITCNVSGSNSPCTIEVTKDGNLINTYDACTKNITLPTTGEYSIACTVNNEHTQNCEMGITVESMTDIPTGTKIVFIVLLSFLGAVIGTYLFKKKTA